MDIFYFLLDHSKLLYPYLDERSIRTNVVFVSRSIQRSVLMHYEQKKKIVSPKYGFSRLHAAICVGNLKRVQELVEIGYSIDALTNDSAVGTAITVVTPKPNPSSNIVVADIRYVNPDGTNISSSVAFDNTVSTSSLHHAVLLVWNKDRGNLMQQNSSSSSSSSSSFLSSSGPSPSTLLTVSSSFSLHNRYHRWKIRNLLLRESLQSHPSTVYDDGTRALMNTLGYTVPFTIHNSFTKNDFTLIPAESSPLHIAALCNNYPIVDYLLTYAKNHSHYRTNIDTLLNLRNSHGEIPFFSSIVHPYNPFFRTSMMQIVSLFLYQYPINPFIPDGWGLNALHVSCAYGNAEMAHGLVDYCLQQYERKKNRYNDSTEIMYKGSLSSALFLSIMDPLEYAKDAKDAGYPGFDTLVTKLEYLRKLSIENEKITTAGK